MQCWWCGTIPTGCRRPNSIKRVNLNFILRVTFLKLWTRFTGRLAPVIKPRFKKLGSQIDRDLDVTHRIERANICFYALLKLWARSITAAPINKRMHIYNVCVKTALLYNIEATVHNRSRLTEARGSPQTPHPLFAEDSLARTHHRRLYETSGATSLRKEIMVRRLSLNVLGKRYNRTDFYWRECMEQYFRHLDEAPKGRGRRPITIVSILDQAFRLDDRRLQAWGDLQVLRTSGAVEIPGE